MNPRIKSILIVIAGTVMATITIMIMESLPLGLEISEEIRSNPVELENFLSHIPFYWYLWIAFGYAVGSLVGGATVHLLDMDSNRNVVKLSAILMTLGILNMLMITQPWWFWGHLIVYFPSAFLGQQIVKRFKKNNLPH